MKETGRDTRAVTHIILCTQAKNWKKGKKSKPGRFLAWSEVKLTIIQAQTSFAAVPRITVRLRTMRMRKDVAMVKKAPMDVLHGLLKQEDHSTTLDKKKTATTIMHKIKTLFLSRNISMIRRLAQWHDWPRLRASLHTEAQ